MASHLILGAQQQSKVKELSVLPFVLDGVAAGFGVCSDVS